MTPGTGPASAPGGLRELPERPDSFTPIAWVTVGAIACTQTERAMWVPTWPRTSATFAAVESAERFGQRRPVQVLGREASIGEHGDDGQPAPGGLGLDGGPLCVQPKPSGDTR